jgi:hypothetical protein
MPSPFSVESTPNAATTGTVATIDPAGNLNVAGSVTTGGAVLLAAQATAPVPPPGYLVLYTADGKTLSMVAPGGQAAGQTIGGNLTVNGNETVNGVLAVSSAQSTSGVLQLTNTVDNASDGTLHMEQFDATSRAIGIRTTGDAQQMWVMLTNGTMAWGAGGASARDTFLARTAAGVLSVTTGSFSVTTAGQGLAVKEGSNAKQGTATLVAGSAVVANTSVTANSRILLTSQADGGTPGFLRVSTRTAGTSFTITSSSGTDTSTVAYQIFEPA